MIVFFVDAPQHLRIVEATLRFVAQRERIVLLTTVGMGGLVKLGSRIECIDIAARPHAGSARSMRILSTGLSVSRACVTHLRKLESVGESRHLVVMGDTGVPHRRLLAYANRHGWNTVLLQDGLVEVRHRESRVAFRLRRRLTTALLQPLGLQWLGTTIYGAGGARRILVDGEVAANFFRNRCPGAEVIVGGLLRPATPSESLVLPRVLFWAVDFLGGLSNESLHLRQLSQIVSLDRHLVALGSGVELVVRLHPRDLPYVERFRQGLASCTVTTIQLPTEQLDPFREGLPLASCSLQSAGVFDALATGVPSVFIDDGELFLGPGWVPEELRMRTNAFPTWIQRFYRDAVFREVAWKRQACALAPAMLIPADAQQVASAWRTP